MRYASKTAVGAKQRQGVRFTKNALIGTIPTRRGKNVNNRIQEWMIDHIWGRPDPDQDPEAA